MNNEIINHALLISVYGMAGIFVFMILFYMVIFLLRRFYPHKPVVDDTVKEEN